MPRLQIRLVINEGKSPFRERKQKIFHKCAFLSLFTSILPPKGSKTPFHPPSLPPPQTKKPMTQIKSEHTQKQVLFMLPQADFSVSHHLNT